MNKKQELGAVTEEDFEQAFDQTPEIDIDSMKELKEIIMTINGKLHSDDWQHRVDNLRLLRSVVKSSKLPIEELLQNIKMLDFEIRSCVSDLRSQVVREACITVAYLSKEIKNKFDLFLEPTIESLLSLVSNGVKIMSTSGKVSLKYIVYNVSSLRILPVFLSSMTTSKSTSSRQFSGELIKIICECWPVKLLDKQSVNISEALKKGICDADEQTRAHSREAFCHFDKKFPKLGEKLLQSLDSTKQKALQREISQFKGDEVDRSGLFKVPTAVVSKTTVKTTAKPANSTGRTRINSAKSENQSAKSKVVTSKIDTGDSRGRHEKISQSQPSTRDPSPAYKTGYITYSNGANDYKYANNFQKKASPNTYSSLRYKDTFENQVAEGLRMNRRNSHDHYQSDDNTSETSSVVSDQLPSFSDVVVLLNSKLWNDRKRGLNKAEKYIMDASLKPMERKALIDIFNLMFQENQPAVIKRFLTVLYVFVDRYHDHITDWLNPLLNKLLNLQANERLKSSKIEVQKLLNLLIDHYSPNLVFMICCKFVLEKPNELPMKIRLCLLEYMKNILTSAPPNLLDTSNPDLGPTLGTIIMWTAETKSTELRKISSNIVIKLFDLNSAQFSRLLKLLPNTFQDRATTILNTYISSNHNETASDVGDSRTQKQKSESEKTSDFIKINTEALQNLSLNYDNFDKTSVLSNNSNKSGTPGSHWGTYQKGAGQNPFFQTKTSQIPTPKQNLNNYSPGNSYLYDNANIQKYLSSQNSHPELSIDNGGSNVSSSLYPSTSNESNVDNKYNPEYYSSGPIDTSIHSNRDVPQNNIELPPEDMMSEILKELSNHNDRHEERKACLFRLIKMFRENTPTDWDEHFKTLLFLLLETMGDNEVDLENSNIKVC